jgi:hypothetical protein
LAGRFGDVGLVADLPDGLTCDLAGRFGDVAMIISFDHTLEAAENG